MENQNAPMQNVFSQSTFDRMCEQAKLFYDATIEKPQLVNAKGAIVEFMVEGSQPAADKYHQLLSAGYTPLPVESPLESFHLVGTAGGVVLIQIHVIKPAEQQAAELSDIFAGMKAQYLKDLEEAQVQEIERQVDLALAAAARADEAKMLAAQEALADKVRAEMQASREKLRAQLIEKGKLNQNGEAA
ncbi:hypothetical protein [Pseudomonas syringae]|uniref:hypothetical protein n=1 Tax=Pseudomonas syringae TaxID=317 RepID=UPI0006CB0753|nr:hypothetical protein [Pseudomonas syringae]ALE01044.1 hypothetical protein PSYRMG_25275 [Pseudomonas syringae UMAF0158]MCK9731911.1 hypothetical protein [Pseudomonas syringae pv. syringae]